MNKRIKIHSGPLGRIQHLLDRTKICEHMQASGSFISFALQVFPSILSKYPAPTTRQRSYTAVNKKV